MTNYRKAEAKDADGAAAVLLKNYNIKSIEEAKEVFNEEINSYRYIVAEEDGKIVGIATWRTHGQPKHQLAQCGRVAVLPEYQGKGIATELFEHLVQDAHKFYVSHSTKLRKIYVYVHSSNKKAQDFYATLGLIKEAVLKDHFYKGEDELVYSMFLE